MSAIDQRELFCHEYVKDFIGAAAARRVGVAVSNARSAACHWLAEPGVRARIEQLKVERIRRTQIDGDRVVEQLANIALADINELIEFRRSCCRHCWGVGFGYQLTDGELRMARARHAKDLKRAQKDGADLVDELTEFDEQGGPGYNAGRDPNPDCPECFGEGFGLPYIKDTRDLSPAALSVYSGVKVTKEGVEVKLQDRTKALELLGRHLGLFNDKLDVNVTGTLAERIIKARRRSGRS